MSSPDTSFFLLALSLPSEPSFGVYSGSACVVLQGSTVSREPSLFVIL